jgi:hypothetical protein
VEAWLTPELMIRSPQTLLSREPPAVRPVGDGGQLVGFAKVLYNVMGHLTGGVPPAR